MEFASRPSVNRQGFRTAAGVAGTTLDQMEMAGMSEQISALHTPPRLVSIPNAAAALGIGRTLLIQLIKERQIASVKLGRRTLVPIDEIDRVIASARTYGSVA